MKKFTISLFAFTAMIALLSLSSCKKIWDYVKHHPDAATDSCRVASVTFNWSINDGNPLPPVVYDTATISYNAQGNPTWIHFLSTTTYNDLISADKGFAYDNQNRLRVYIEYAHDDLLSCFYWHKYTYTNSTTVIDTTYFDCHGDINYNDGTPGLYVSLSVTTYTLDSYGRIIQSAGPGGTATFSYDTGGNLVKPGVTYTDKVNINQTNKVWMFIANDFSLNQADGDATQFNSNDLPTAFNTLSIFTFPEGSPKDIKVNYLCN